MTRIKILSDLHFEAQPDKGVAMCKIIKRQNQAMDVLVVAGDLTDANYLAQSLTIICKAVAPKPVVYVLGNHEYYHSNREDVRDIMTDLGGHITNLHWLDDNHVTLNGTRFIGASLWFPSDPLNILYEKAWSDFIYCPTLARWVYAENADSQAYLRANVREGDVVVTHHLPTRFSIAPEWEGQASNRFFLCDMRDVIEEQKPKIWFHGHTHNSFDYPLAATRVICNPYGYEGHQLNRIYDSNKVVIV